MTPDSWLASVPDLSETGHYFAGTAHVRSGQRLNPREVAPVFKACLKREQDAARFQVLRDGAAGLDPCLHLVRRDFGAAVAAGTPKGVAPPPSWRLGRT